MKRSPVRKKRATPRRRKAPRHTDPDWWINATQTLLRRCGHRCERCGDPLRDQIERHHRQRRAAGGDRIANLMALHPYCHQWITEHPDFARHEGWIVPATGIEDDPANVPIRLDGYWWLLDDQGGKTPVP